jgi:hypothetical protein
MSITPSNSDNGAGGDEKVATPPLFLRRADAANYLQERYGLRCAKQTLAKLAVLGGGPIFRHAGRTPIYAPADLDEWALSQIGKPRTSTSVLAEATVT